ncbi:MAG TPA: hypothetical protein VMW81_01695 [Nitrospinota bacterium]|nr:hypothetical protein [Nitrospinota bacterium]
MGEITGVDMNISKNIENEIVVEKTKSEEDQEDLSLKREKIEKSEIDERLIREENQERARKEAMKKEGVGNYIDDLI